MNEKIDQLEQQIERLQLFKDMTLKEWNVDLFNEDILELIDDCIEKQRMKFMSEIRSFIRRYSHAPILYDKTPLTRAHYLADLFFINASNEYVIDKKIEDLCEGDWVLLENGTGHVRKLYPKIKVILIELFPLGDPEITMELENRKTHNFPLIEFDYTNMETIKAFISSFTKCITHDFVMESIMKSSLPDRYSVRDVCVICADRRKNALCTPCNHMSYCYECLRKVVMRGQNCSICRGEIVSVIKVHL